jgi:four helix bundle protein
VVDLAVDVARDVAAAVRGVRGRHGDLVDQVLRASESVALNLAEGAGRTGRDKPYHYGVAYASAGEALTALRILAAYRAIDPGLAMDLQARLDQVRAIAWRLMHRG